MKKANGIITTNNPTWLETIVPPEYEDQALYEIILFFVIHSPCEGQSMRGISLAERGWKSKPWNSPKYLKEKLDIAIFGNESRLIKMVKSKADMLQQAEAMDFGDDFYNHRTKQRALYTHVKGKGCDSEYMSLFYHIRNALAHGRLAMYPAKGGDITFVMEDGKNNGSETDNKFEVSARIVINKSSLLNIIGVLKNPPEENDYSDDILIAVENGCNTKSALIKELELNEQEYEKYIQLLKSRGLIKYEHKKWTMCTK